MTILQARHPDSTLYVLMEVVIIGAGGHGRVVLDILRAVGQYQPIGFIDANYAGMADKTIADLQVLGDIKLLPRLRDQNISRAIIAIGDNQTRLLMAQILLEQGFELVNAIHPASHLSSGITIGKNVVISAGAIVGTQTTLADSTIINTGAVVDHECQIGRGVHIAPAAALAGRVRVEEGAFVGLGARVIQTLTIGQYAIIGAGAAVLKDVPPRTTVVGVPARELPLRKSGTNCLT